MREKYGGRSDPSLIHSCEERGRAEPGGGPKALRHHSESSKHPLQHSSPQSQNTTAQSQSTTIKQRLSRPHATAAIVLNQNPVTVAKRLQEQITASWHVAEPSYAAYSTFLVTLAGRPLVSSSRTELRYLRVRTPRQPLHSSDSQTHTDLLSFDVYAVSLLSACKGLASAKYQ